MYIEIMIIKHIAMNGGVYYNVTPAQQRDLHSLIRPAFRNTVGVCHTCDANCDGNSIIFNCTISEMQCVDCFNDWQKHYTLSKEDYKRQAYTAESVYKILNEK